LGLTSGALLLSSAGDGGNVVLLSRILDHAGRHPNKIAVVSNGAPINYETFAKGILKIRCHAAQALPPICGTAIIASPGLLNLWLISIALRSLGITTVAARDLETIGKLRHFPGAMLVCASRREGYVPTAHQRWPDLPIFELPIEAINAIRDDALPSTVDDSRFGDYIEFTSGSTGDHKILVRSGAAVEQLWTRTAAEFRLDRSSAFHLHSLTAWTAVGGKCPLTCWALGATCLFDQRYDNLHHLLDLPINRLFVTPAQIRTLAAMDLPKPRDPDLQIYCGGGFLAAPLVAQLREKLRCRIFLNYAGSEFGVRLQSEIQVEEDAIWLRPLPNADLRLVDELGEPAADDQEAVIQVKLHACDPRPYSGEPASGEAGVEGSWFNTNDLATRRADGRIRILGRAEDVLNISGQKVPVGPVEERARTLLGIDSLCLFTRQADDGEDYLLVAIEGDQDPENRRVTAFRAELGQYFNRIELRTLATFPRPSSGMQKVNRREILRQVEQPD